jgi:two-component system, NtrC family, response regulator HydG
MTMEKAQPESILVVDDVPAAVELLRRNLEAADYRVLTASGLEEATRLLDRVPIDLVVTDLRMPRGGGLELIRYVRENLSDTEVMLVTGFATIEGAVEALKAGAAEYLVKPYTDRELFDAVERSLAKLRLRKTAHGASPGAAPPGLIGKSQVMLQVYSQITKAASTTATVMISGESGTGKELVARAIHYVGPRRSAPFVPVSCGAIPESLLESELFGHVKGAFTGAAHSRAGFFQTAEHGTIFLDEISETSPATQMKLLRVLQDREIYMVGSSRARTVDVRVLAATNKNLAQLVAKGAFREDLYYRVNVLAIEIPPLRGRGEDILLLAGHFSEKYSDELGRPKLRFSDGALRGLLHYHWPGNVRELQNLIQRLVVMKEGEFVDVPDLPSAMRSGPTPGVDSRSLAQLEADHIRGVLAGARGNKSQAARILGIDRKTLYEKIRRYALTEQASHE